MFWRGSKSHEVDDLEELARRGIDPQVAPQFTKSREEKWFIFKLDVFLLTFGCISQVIKYLDQTNITTAYVSGMSDDLNLNGNELNYFTTYFNVGYCIFLIPSQVMITRVRPAIWLSCLEFFWGCLTLGIAFCKSAKQIYVLRAFIGLAESSAYPGTVTLLMTWYTPLEMAKRIGFYHSCQALGGMLSGALQTAIHRSLEGSGGLRGWQWTFVINAIMTLIIALCGPFMLPDFPKRPNSWALWFKPKDKEIADLRLKRFTRESPNPISIATAKRAIMNPMLYMFIWIYTGMLIAPSGNSYFQLWLKTLKNPDGTAEWNITALNAIPLGGYAMQISAVWFFALTSDIVKTRWTLLLSQCIIGLPPTIIMSIWNVPKSAKYFSYFILYITNASGPLLWSWLSDMLPRDAEQRALIIGCCISLYYAINAWSNVLIWPASQAPHYKYGWPVSVALWVSCALVICSMRVYDIKVVRPRNYRIAHEVAEYSEAQTSVTVDDLNNKSDIDIPKSGPSTTVTVAAVPSV